MAFDDQYVRVFMANEIPRDIRGYAKIDAFRFSYFRFSKKRCKEVLHSLFMTFLYSCKPIWIFFFELINR